MTGRIRKKKPQWAGAFRLSDLRIQLDPFIDPDPYLKMLSGSSKILILEKVPDPNEN